MKTNEFRGKRILIVQQSLNLGGAERQGLYFAQWLHQEIKANVHFLALSSHIDCTVGKQCQVLGIPVSVVKWDWYSKSKRNLLRGLLEVWWHVVRLRPFVIFPYTMPANVAMGVIWKYTTAKACIWNQRDEGAQRIKRRLEELAITSVTGFISNSDHGASFLEEEFNVSRKSISVVRNGIDLSLFQQDDNQQYRGILQLKSDTFICGMIANFHPRKDHFTLLQAWSKVVKQNENVHLVLLGRGKNDAYGEQLQRKAKELDIAGSVSFVDGAKVGDVGLIISILDLGLHISNREGVSNAILEMMSFGKPVLVSDFSGNLEAIGERRNDFISRQEDAKDLAKKILIHVNGDKKNLTDYGQVLKKRVEFVYNIETMCCNTLKAASDAIK